MKNQHPSPNRKSRTWGLAMAALLIPVAMAAANSDHAGHAGHDVPVAVRSNLSGNVEVVHQVPGGAITVGADWGKQHRPEPAVVVVEERPQVVVEKEARHRHHHGRRVTVIHEQPRQVTIIRNEPVRREVVVVENRAGRDGDYDRPNGIREDRRSETENDRYYRDGKQVSVDKVTRNGTHHYYEDADQVSIQDNRDGRQRNVYVRK